mgnify:CR=1 FL=1
MQHPEGLHRDRFNLVSQQNHLAFKPRVAGFAEFETIGAAQLPSSRHVAHQCQRDAGDRVIKKLHVRIVTGTPSRVPRDFKGAQAVEPEPAKRSQQ